MPHVCHAPVSILQPVLTGMYAKRDIRSSASVLSAVVLFCTFGFMLIVLYVATNCGSLHSVILGLFLAHSFMRTLTQSLFDRRMIQILIDLDSRVDSLASQLEESKVNMDHVSHEVEQMLDTVDKYDSSPGVCPCELLAIFIIQ